MQWHVPVNRRGGRRRVFSNASVQSCPSIKSLFGLALRQGLESLGKSPDETQTFFDALLKLHEPVLKLRRMRARPASTSSSSSCGSRRCSSTSNAVVRSK